MHRFRALYEAYAALFPHPGSRTHTVHAVAGERGLTLPDQKELISNELVNMGLPWPISFTYKVVFGNKADEESAKGALIILGNRSPAQLFVEDNLVFPEPSQQTISVAATSAERSGSPSTSTAVAPRSQDRLPTIPSSSRPAHAPYSSTSRNVVEQSRERPMSTSASSGEGNRATPATEGAIDLSNYTG
jgi:hypothetical protein